MAQTSGLSGTPMWTDFTEAEHAGFEMFALASPPSGGTL
jgi:hypothetical protein